MTITSTVNIINLSGLAAQNGNDFNLINYSGGQYNVITTGLLSNYLDNNTLLSAFYTNINSLNRWIAPSYYVAQPPEDMIINIITQGPNEEMVLPFKGISSINVNWDNGLISTYTTSNPSTIYSAIGTYSIRISGYVTSFGNDGSVYNGSNLISSVSQWGTIGLTSLSGAFYQASNLVSLPSTIPQYINNTSNMFSFATNFNQDISLWNTSNISSMENMFNTASIFNQNLSDWKVSSVSTANYIFCNCPQMLATPAYRPIFNIPYISSCS
jgi:hypothetical protein